MIFSKKLSKRKILWGLCALLFAGAMMSCVVDDKDDDKDDEPPAIDNPVQTTPEISSLTVSGTTAIEATKSSDLTATPTFTVSPADSSSVTYKWEITEGADYASLSATSSANVTLTGKNTTETEQTVTVKVTATYGGKSVSETYYVKIAAKETVIPDEITALKLTAEASSVSAKGTVNLTAQASYTGSPEITFSWEITSGTDYASLKSDTARATQTETNTLIGKNTTETEQSVTVKVTASDGTNEEVATCTVTVGAKIVVPTVTAITVYSGINGTSKKGEYNTVTEALSACGSSGDFRIVLPAGTYAENGLVYNGSGTIRITGSGSAKHGTDVVIKGHGSTMPVDGGSSAQNARELLLFRGTGNLILENLTLESDWLRSEHSGVSAMQAEVLGFNASGYVAAYNCSFISHQDTVRTVGKGWFYDCHIEGDVDFIWMEAGGKVALYENCEIVSVYDSAASNHSTYIAAPKINLGNTAGKGVVVFNSSITAPANQKTYLFRNPWSGDPTKQYNQAAFVNCTIDGTLESALSLSDANGTADQQYIGWKVDSTIASAYTSKASKIGTLSADTEEKEYSGRRAILNRNYIVDSARFEKDTASNWDIDSFISTVGWSVDADPSKDYYDGETITKVYSWDMVTNNKPSTGYLASTQDSSVKLYISQAGGSGGCPCYHPGTGSKVYIPASVGDKVEVVTHSGNYYGFTLAGKAATSNAETLTVTETVSSGQSGDSNTYVLLDVTGNCYIHSITVTGTGSSSGGEGGGESGGSGSGGTSGNVISKNDTPTGFATIDVSKMTKIVTVSSKADFKKYVEAGGYIVYVSGTIDLSEGMLPTEAGGSTSALDAFVKAQSGGAYTSYKAFIDAYTNSCTNSSNQKDNPKKSSWAACTVSGDTATTLMNQMWYLNTNYGNAITIKPKSNTMIIGLDENAEIYGGCFNISSVSNVAIRNVTIRDAYDPFPHHEKNDGFNAQHDCIVIQGTSNNIWIDHCTLKDSYHCVNAANGEKFQTYDGLLDMKNNTYNLTVSYCKFQDHDKTMLIGSSQTDGSNETRTITLHHNYFLNCGQRLPMVRNTRLHNFNNYYDTDSNRYWAQQYAVGVKENALIVSENNYFGTGVKYSYKDSDGTLYHSGDVDNSSGKITTTTVTSTKPFTPTYSYTPDAAADLPTLIPENAGAGVWSVVQ